MVAISNSARLVGRPSAWWRCRRYGIRPSVGEGTLGGSLEVLVTLVRGLIAISVVGVKETTTVGLATRALLTKLPDLLLCPGPLVSR